MIALAIPAAIICALVNRWRGGLWWGPGHGVRRLVLAATFTLIFIGAAWPLAGWQWAGVGAAVLTGWLGLTFEWGEWVDLGTVAGEVKTEMVALLGRGLLLSALWAAPLIALDPSRWPLAYIGLGMAPAYWIGWRLPKVLVGGTAAGEMLFGAWLGATIWILGSVL